jgi:hypothetical protein
VIEAMPPASVELSDLSFVVISLMKGPLYRDTNEKLWRPLLEQRNQVSDYVNVIGLSVVIDESEGFAYLRSRSDDDATALPRLVARRALPFHTSLLLALLRKRLAEFDANSAEARLILGHDQMVEMLRLYMTDSTNDARVVDSIGGHVNRAVELGFLRPLRNEPNLYEVRRILKAYIDGQWLNEFNIRLDEYLDELNDVEESL